MITTLATIVSTQDHTITVHCQQQSTCGSCASKSSCGSGIVENSLPKHIHEVVLKTPQAQQLTIGQWVEIGLSERSMIHSALLMYMIPLLGLLIGCVVGAVFFGDTNGHESGIIACSVLFSGLGFGISRYFARRLEQNSDYHPSLLRILGEPICGDRMINATLKDSD